MLLTKKYPSREADLLEHIARDWAGEGDRWNTESSGTDRVHNTGDDQDEEDEDDDDIRIMMMGRMMILTQMNK